MSTPDPTRDRRAEPFALDAVAAMQRSDARLSAAIDDFFLPDDSRLDDRTRAALARQLGAIVGAIETDIRRHAARVLTGWAEEGAAVALVEAQGEAIDRLLRVGVLRDRSLMEQLIARVRQDLLAAALPIVVEADQPSVLVRLTDVGDSVVAAAAAALLAAQSRRRSANDLGVAAGSELSAENHHRLVWWVAAAIRTGMGSTMLADRAIEEAALRSLAAHDEGERLEALATRLAIAIDARPDELPSLLLDILGDRTLALFVAVLARATGLDYEQIRAVLLDPVGDELWLVLRAASLDRPTIARIGLSLADADQRRDIETLADRLDAIVAIAPADALTTLAPLTLHADLRRAIGDLARGSAA